MSPGLIDIRRSFCSGDTWSLAGSFVVSCLDKSFPSRGHKNVYARTCVVFLPVDMSFGHGVDRGTQGKRLEKRWIRMEGRINWRARYGSVDTSGSLTILENTFLPRDNVYVYKKRKNIVSHGWDSKGAAAHRLGPKDGQRLWGRENVSLDNFEKKLSSTRVRIHDIISFFFLNRCMEFLGEGERESHRYFMEVEETCFETRVDRENVGLSLRLIKCVAQRDIYIYIKCT